MITARDSKGKQTATSSFGGPSGYVFVELDCGTATVASFEIHGSSRSSFDRICGLEFDNRIAPQVPDFQLAYTTNTTTGLEIPLRPIPANKLVT